MLCKQEWKSWAEPNRQWLGINLGKNSIPDKWEERFRREINYTVTYGPFHTSYSYGAFCIPFKKTPTNMVFAWLQYFLFLSFCNWNGICQSKLQLLKFQHFYFLYWKPWKNFWLIPPAEFQQEENFTPTWFIINCIQHQELH